MVFQRSKYRRITESFSVNMMLDTFSKQVDDISEFLKAEGLDMILKVNWTLWLSTVEYVMVFIFVDKNSQGFNIQQKNLRQHNK